MTPTAGYVFSVCSFFRDFGWVLAGGPVSVLRCARATKLNSQSLCTEITPRTLDRRVLLRIDTTRVWVCG